MMSDHDTSDLPTSWSLILVGGSTFMISEEVRREIEVWMREVDRENDPSFAKTAHLTVTGLLGQELTIMFDGINCLYDTSPASRLLDRLYGKLIREEALEQGFPDDD